MRIPRETKMEYAIAFLVETRGEILWLVNWLALFLGRE